MTHARSAWMLFALVTFLARPVIAQDLTAEDTAAQDDTARDTAAQDDAARDTTAASSSARALDDDARDRTMEHLRFEGTLGFLGGWARYADQGLGGSLPEGAFDAGPVAGAPIAGLRYDVRLVVAFVRMTAGADLAWSLFDARESSRALAFDDGARTLRDRSVFLWSLRFGLGLELAATDDVRLFADLLGSVRFLEVQSLLEGTPVTSSVTSFAPGLRVGARMRVVDAFFVQLAADASPMGPWVTGELSVGGAIE